MNNMVKGNENHEKNLVLVLAFALSIVACASEKNDNSRQNNNSGKNNNSKEKKVLVAYFSQTGNTEAVAKKVAELTNADLFEIVAKTPYSSEDLNWTDENSRVSKENKDKNARPEIKEKVANFEEYDIVFLGYPTWWRNSPRIMSAFVESYNFNGKTVIPFATSMSSESSSKDLEKIADNAKWRNVQRFPSGVSETEVENWVKSLGI